MLNALFYSSLLLIPIGLTMRYFILPGGALFMAIGFAGTLIYFVARTIKRTTITGRFGIDRVFEFSIALMSITLFSRYLFYRYWDIPGIIILPIYIGLLVASFIKRKKLDHKLISTNVLFVLLVVPLFGWDFYKDPRDLIPTEWYDRYDISDPVVVSLPWIYETSEAAELGEHGFRLMKTKDYETAIDSLFKGLKFERNPRLYFDLSQCYANINELEIAIQYLDTLLSIDNQYPYGFNNRGLLHYKLKNNLAAIDDYLTAIEIDSSVGIYHSSLALAYYHNEDYAKACQEFQIAKEMNAPDVDNYPKLVKKSCQ